MVKVLAYGAQVHALSSGLASIILKVGYFL